MNLQELQESKKINVIKRALREHYELDVDFSRMNRGTATEMLSRVRGLLKESRTSKDKYDTHKSSAYMKLVMLEQALGEHLRSISVQSRIVLENEEVQKSQVILAAQDMIDSVQKMLEQVSKMNVEELSAVVDGINSEFGTSEGQQFQQSASESLTTLQSALTTAKTALQGALGTITGEGGGDLGGDMGAEGGDMGGDLGGEEELDVQADVDMEPPAEELPEPEEDLGGAGRELR